MNRPITISRKISINKAPWTFCQRTGSFWPKQIMTFFKNKTSTSGKIKSFHITFQTIIPSARRLTLRVKLTQWFNTLEKSRIREICTNHDNPREQGMPEIYSVFLLLFVPYNWIKYHHANVTNIRQGTAIHLAVYTAPRDSILPFFLTNSSIRITLAAILFHRKFMLVCALSHVYNERRHPYIRVHTLRYHVLYEIVFRNYIPSPRYAYTY